MFNYSTKSFLHALRKKYTSRKKYPIFLVYYACMLNVFCPRMPLLCSTLSRNFSMWTSSAPSKAGSRNTKSLEMSHPHGQSLILNLNHEIWGCCWWVNFQHQPLKHWRQLPTSQRPTVICFSLTQQLILYSFDFVVKQDEWSLLKIACGLWCTWSLKNTYTESKENIL